MTITPVLLATGNRDKQAQLRPIFDGLPFAPLTPTAAGAAAPTDDECGETHEAIARQKAAQWSSAANGMLAIASDGGLVIPALGPQWESRHTRRFAGPAADNRQRQALLLELMQPYQGESRRAQWVESLALARHGQVLASWQLTGATGYIDNPPPGNQTSDADTVDMPEFWVFNIWRIPQFNAPYRRLTPQQRESAGDHWTRLRRQARRYLTATFVA